jgi:hypothetical protein
MRTAASLWLGGLVTHCWSSLRAEVEVRPHGMRRTVRIPLHATHLGLLRPFLHNWFGLALSEIEHIIGKGGAALVVNSKPGK